MEKSTMYKLAQVAVVQHGGMNATTKLEVLRLLMDQEYFALLVEKQEEKKKAEVEKAAAV